MFGTELLNTLDQCPPSRNSILSSDAFPAALLAKSSALAAFRAPQHVAPWPGHQIGEYMPQCAGEWPFLPANSAMLPEYPHFDASISSSDFGQKPTWANAQVDSPFELAPIFSW